MPNTKLMRIAFIVLLSALALYFLAPIMTPFFLGALLAYLGDPLVSYLNKKHIPRTIGVIFVFLAVIIILTAAVFLVLPMIQNQLALAVNKIPALLSWIQDTVLPWMHNHIQNDDAFNVASLKKELGQYSQKLSKVAPVIVKTATHSTFALINFVMNLVLVPVVAFYLMRDWPKIVKNIQEILPVSSRKVIVNVANQCDEVVGAFFKGQLLVMLALAIIYSSGLRLLGLEIAVFVGLISGLFAIVPYLGFIVGIMAASVAMYIETHSMVHVLAVCGVYGVGQMLESMVLTPWLVGDKIGLHPVAVIFAVLAGGELFGFMGVLLALPVAAVILVVIKRMMTNEKSHATCA